MLKVTCFLASYAVALAFEGWHLWRPRPIWRWLAAGWGLAGLVAQTLFLLDRRPPLVWPFGWMLFLAWVLAIFYLCGALHHRRQAWGVFVLPVVLGLLVLGVAFGQPDGPSAGLLQVESLWGPVHVILIMLAAVGICVGFVASLMYLVQAHRLRVKAPPGRGLRLLSLERLEAMNRRAIVLAFPLLTAGMIAGAVLLARSDSVGWSDPRVIGTAVLWLAFAILLVLRLAHQLRGRQVALLTIVAFAMLLFCIVLSHATPEVGP